MAITNGYSTLAEFKAFAIPRASIDAADDGVLEDLIESASRIIDRETGRQFYASGTALAASSRYFNVPEGNNGRRLWLDADLQSIDAAGITNGDGETLAATEYYLEPRNDTPKYAITIKQASSYYWAYDDDGNSEYVIEVPGIWGYCATGSHPDDVKEACQMIALSSYLRRHGQNLSERSLVTAAGVIITPDDIPARAWQIIKSYRRLVYV
jgi:hypothetical protein